jgi:hypothetical protein
MHLWNVNTAHINTVQRSNSRIAEWLSTWSRIPLYRTSFLLRNPKAHHNKRLPLESILIQFRSSQPISLKPILILPSRMQESGELSRYSDGLRTERPGFNHRQKQNFSLLHRVQTDIGTHPSSYPIGTGGDFPGGKATGPWTWPHLHLVPWSRRVEPYLHSPISLHGIVLN